MSKERNGNTALGVMLNVFGVILMIVPFVIALGMFVPQIAGYQEYTVVTESMEPEIPVGSLVLVKGTDPETLEKGDVVSYERVRDPGTIITHRVVENTPDTRELTTKGDANEAEDGSLVHYKNVIGTPVFTVPKLGYLASYIQNPPGTYAAISAGAILLLLVFLPDLFADGKGKEKNAEKKKAPVVKATVEKKVTAENVEEIIRLAETDAEAQNLLCEAYWYGDVVEKDLKKSFFYAEKAAAQNNTQAMINLSFYLRKGIECKRDFERAEDLVLRAAQMGDSDAYGDLAEMYLFGMGPIEQNLDEAFYYMDKMVEADAKDKEEVLGWFGLSAEQFAVFYAQYLDGEIDEDRIKMMEAELKKGQPEEYLPYQTKKDADEYED